MLLLLSSLLTSNPVVLTSSSLSVSLLGGQGRCCSWPCTPSMTGSSSQYPPTLIANLPQGACQLHTGGNSKWTHRPAQAAAGTPLFLGGAASLSFASSWVMLLPAGLARCGWRPLSSRHLRLPPWWEPPPLPPPGTGLSLPSWLCPFPCRSAVYRHLAALHPGACEYAEVPEVRMGCDTSRTEVSADRNPTGSPRGTLCFLQSSHPGLIHKLTDETRPAAAFRAGADSTGVSWDLVTSSSSGAKATLRTLRPPPSLRVHTQRLSGAPAPSRTARPLQTT